MNTLVLFSTFTILLAITALDSSDAAIRHRDQAAVHEIVCFQRPKTEYCPPNRQGLYWFYAPEKKTCIQFNGCSVPHNYLANNFKTSEECHEFCDGVGTSKPRKPSYRPRKPTRPRIPTTPADKPARCFLPPVSGPCKADFQMWYYDSTIKQCTTFIYGGCGGNSNRFDSKEDCMENCD